MYKIKLSPFQKIFLNDWQIDPNRSDYNIVSDQFLYGELYIDKLNLAIQNFVNNYVLFNSYIEIINEEPMWIKSPHTAELQFFEAPISDGEIYKYVSQSFNLTRDRLYRFLLIQYTKNKYRFIVIFHHILVSSFSVENNVFRLLLNYYKNDIPYIKHDYKEQVTLLNTLANKLNKKVNANINSSKKFWHSKLNGLEALDLKFLSLNEGKIKDKKMDNSLVKEYRFDFNEQDLIQTNQVVRKYKITPYLFGQMIFAYLLSRHTQQKKFAISYPFAIKEGAEFIYGAQINTSFIAYDFNHVEYFSDIVTKTKQFITEVKNKGEFDYRYCPISEVMDVNNKGLLEIAFIQTNLKDILFEFDSIQSVAVNNDLNIDLNNKLLFEQEIKDKKIKFRVKYRVNEVNTNLLFSFIKCYQRLYHEILKDECKEAIIKPLKNYSILSSEDYHKIVYTWNSTEQPYPIEKTIHALFEAQANQTPDNIAVTYEGKQLTYRDLNFRSNQLAHYLRKNYNIQPNDLIGICLERSEHLIIAIFGVLKSGAAYVPIDPTYPNKRIEYVLNDTKAKIVLTSKLYLEKLNPIFLLLDYCTDALVLDANKTVKLLANESTMNLSHSNQYQDLAYVIYTSGTTGLPKGVMIEHRNLVVFISGFVDFPLKNMVSRNMLSMTNYVFDIFGLEFLLPLLSGYNLHLFDILNPKKKIKINQYDCLQMTPSILQLLIENIDYQMSAIEKNHTIKILIGGETVTGSAINELRKLETKLIQSGILVNFEIINVYGPTETTIWSVAGYIESENLSSENKLGYPLKNECIYILDEDLNPLPIGSVGEIYIGGYGVARGYIHNPDLTHKKFIPNPFLNDGRSDRKLLYRTGDLGRWHPNGVIEFIGRQDFQVKLYGHRIELTEIESCLNNYPEIKQSAVILANSKKNTQYLIGYYVADKELCAEDIQAYLSEQLPHFMHPNKMIYLSKFPLTSSGKIDKKKLMSYDLETLSENTHVAPRNKLETMLCVAFAHSLGVEANQVGLYDDFFKLGGTSLLAIKVVSTLRKQFNFNMEVTDIFKYRTVCQLAEKVNFFKKVHYGPVVDEKNKIKSPVLSFAQERMWILAQYKNGSKAYNVPLIFKLKPEYHIEILIESFKAVVKRHEILRTIIKRDKQGNVFPQVLPVELDINVKHIETKESLHALLQESMEHIFSLNLELPIKIHVYEYKNEFYISMVIHHIAFDGWSADILIHDLVEYYRYYSQSDIENLHPLELPKISIQYQDFALWQKKYLNTKAMKEQILFWEKKLYDYEQLNLPMDKPRPVVFDYNGKTIEFALPIKLSADLRACAKTLGVSLYSLLLSGFYLLLRVYSNQNDIVLGTMVANRHYKNADNLVGFFVNTLVLRQQINSESKLIDFVHAVLGEVIEAQQHQDIPFEKLVDKLNISKDLSRHPIFQVVFGVQDFGSRYQDLFSKYPYVHMNATAKFDFSLVFDDSNENLEGSVEYATSLFEEQTIKGYLKTYQIILEQLSKLKDQQSKDMIIKSIYYLDLLKGSQIKIGSRKVELSKIEWVLNSYHGVKQCIAILNKQKSSPYLIAYYVKEIDTAHEHSLDMLTDWKNIYNLTYSKLNFDDNSFIGWNSSYTGVPISPEQMHEWQSEALSKIKQLPAKRILEIGSGSGLLLYKLIERSLFYYAFDFSEQAIHYNKKNVDDLGCSKKFKGFVASADKIDFKKISKEYDMVILNSVIQYFPSLEYLEKILIRAIENIDESGQIFIGDIRDFRLLECFAYSVIQFKKGTVSVADIEYFKIREKELLIAPEYFLSLKNKINNISLVELLPKLGSAMNEMNAYRYDVILYINKNVATSALKVNYKQFKKTTDIETLIKNENHEILFAKYPNYRVAKEYTAYRNLYEDKCEISLKSIAGLLDVKHLTKSFAKMGYNIRMFLDVESPLYWNIVAYKNLEFENIEMDYSEINLHQHSFANDPLQNRMLIDAQYNKELKKYLSAQLPDYMVPQYLIPIDKIPLNANGKIDYNLLPAPEFKINNDYIQPNTPLEKVLCKIFSQILSIEEDKIGVKDNFFEMGGNSLLAIKLVYKINSKLKYNIQMVDVFTRNTIQDLVAYLSSLKSDLGCVTQLNRVDDKLNMFMIHPAFASSEVYVELANRFSEYSCYGLDNYNLEHHEKIEDIRKVAENYLAIIYDIRKQTHQEDEPYVLLGWSLGGQIALNIANILEGNGVENIYLILIDSVYPDDAFAELLSQVVLDQTQLKNFAEQIGIDARYTKKVKNNFQCDLQLSFQGAKIKLQRSRLLLFKAMKKEAIVFLKNYDPLKEYVINLPYNNLDKAVDTKNIHLVKLNDSNHFNLLEQHELIYQNTVSFVGS